MSLEDCASGVLTEKIVPAKNGYTVCVGEISIHSRYNPMQEAEKYIASLHLEKPYRYFILIEPGLGYLAEVLEKQFPQAGIIVLHCSAFYDSEKLRPLLQGENFQNQLNAPGWNPSCEESLENFLEKNIADADASGIRLIEWKPSVNAYGRACADLAARTVECIRRITAGKNTVKQFGRRWLRNALRNLELVRNPVEFRAGLQPVLVCAAGPGLEDSLDAIAGWMQSPSPPLLVAVSSAAPALLHRKIIPDIIVATDGGPWALFHLVEIFRGFECFHGAEGLRKTPVLAAALTAALPSQAETQPILILSDGSLWQETLLGSCGIPFARFPQRGTVSATALDLALLFSGGPVYLAGLDFSHRDLKTHARPHTFEKLLENSSSRYRPAYSQTFERESTISKSGSLGIYATWFKTHVNSIPQKLYTLSPSSLELPQAELPHAEFPQAEFPPNAGIEPAGKSGGSLDAPPTIHCTVHHGFNPPGKKKGIAVLQDALSSPLTAKQTEKELGELLFPDDLREDGNFSGLLKKEVLELFDKQTWINKHG